MRAPATGVTSPRQLAPCEGYRRSPSLSVTRIKATMVNPTIAPISSVRTRNNSSSRFLMRAAQSRSATPSFYSCCDDAWEGTSLLRMFPKLRRTSDACRGDWKMQDTQLREHHSLIPIEVLAGHFATANLNDDHERELHCAA